MMGFSHLRAKLRHQKDEIDDLNNQIKEQVLVRYLPPALINDIFDEGVYGHQTWPLRISPSSFQTCLDLPR